MIRVIWQCLFLMLAATVQADTLRMAVTTSFENSGLSDVLLPEIEKDTGHQIQLIVVGTGQALKLGQAGDVDAVLVHSKAAEIAFVEAGYGPYRREIMYNDFVIVGPVSDPAGLGKITTAVDALHAIAAGGHLFASRGDDSGTHKAELALWEKTKMGHGGRWYRETGSGMGTTLNVAVAIGAYVLTDRASWINFGNTGDFQILFEGDPMLFNQYAFLPVSDRRHPHVNARAVQEVETWLVSAKGQALIGQYQLDGQNLFFPNAEPRP